MDEKINPQLVQEYSMDYASHIVEPFFADSEKISGTEISRLSDIHQVNLFVLRELLKSWKQESQKYKSPYFDYDAPAVQDALKHFRNVLSNHIAIAKDHFIPILRKSVSLTIYLILSPYDFYAYILNKYGSSNVRADVLRSEIKYIKINKAPLELLIHKLDKEPHGTMNAKDAFTLLESILEEVNFTPEDISPYITVFGKAVPIDVSKLYETEENSSVLMSFQDNAIDTILSERPAQRTSSVTVAEGYQKIAHLRERLTINQKFMFTKMLFNGNFDSFNRAITKIDSLTSLEEATHYLDMHYANWNRGSEEYMEFVELLNKRFA